MSFRNERRKENPKTHPLENESGAPRFCFPFRVRATRPPKGFPEFKAAPPARRGLRDPARKSRFRYAVRPGNLALRCPQVYRSDHTSHPSVLDLAIPFSASSSRTGARTSALASPAASRRWASSIRLLHRTLFPGHPIVGYERLLATVHLEI